MQTALRIEESRIAGLHSELYSLGVVKTPANMKAAIVLLFTVAAVMSYHGVVAVPATSSARPSTTGRPSTTTPRPPTSTGEPVEKCPKVNGVYVTVIPNPADCTTYFACETGTPILMHCPAGLHFNPRLHVCDLPANAKCQKV